MLREFKKFIMRGNVLELAVGIMIGTAFNKLVGSLVNGILMPPLELLIGNADYSDLFVTLTGSSEPALEKAKEAGAVTINYGLFLSSAIHFLLMAVAVFLIVRQANRIHRRFVPPNGETKPLTKECPYCCESIPMQATRCPRCTSHLPSGAITQQQPPVC